MSQRFKGQMMAEKRKFEATTSDAGDGLSAQEASDKITYESPDAIRGEEDAKCPVEKIPRLKLSKAAKNNQQRLIVVLEKANLEIVKVGKAFELITCDEHMSLIRKYKKDPAFCRPDITHQVRFFSEPTKSANLPLLNLLQCLLMLFDSPLNRAGLLQVYIHTRQNVLIDVNPQTRFPRTFKRFANLMG